MPDTELQSSQVQSAHGALGGFRAFGRDFATVVGCKDGLLGGLELLEDKEGPQD